jgi:peptide/nickel transport system permease protein
MLTFIVRRLAGGVVLLAAIAVVGFTLLYLGGGDIARRILGESADQATVAAKSHELGLDRPLVVQFGDWAGHAVRGDFGASWFTGQPVADAITSRLAVTLSLVIGAIALIAVVSVVLGVLAATRRSLQSGGAKADVQPPDRVAGPGLFGPGPFGHELMEDALEQEAGA